MKNYKDSDYARNKFSEGIVYRFADRIVEITLKDYLAENPNKTVEDFMELKALSDEIYHQQVINENRTSRLDVSINGLEDTGQLATVPLDTEWIHKSDSENAMIIKLRQWIGRGIRRETDTCVFSILDSRASGRYINDILAALPDMPVTDRMEDVGRFILSHKDDSYFA